MEAPPVLILVDTLMAALKDAVPEVAGRVFLRRSIPVQMKETPFIQVTVDGGSVEMLDQSPPMASRTVGIGISAVARGDNQESCWIVLKRCERVRRIMREIQMIPDVDPSQPCLIDYIKPTGSMELQTLSNGDKDYTCRTLNYEAEFVTDEGATGESGPGIPEINLLKIFKRMSAKWSARRGDQELLAEDDLAYQEGQSDEATDQGE